MFHLANVVSIGCEIQFQVLIYDAGEVQLITLFLHLFLAFLGSLESYKVYLLEPCFTLLMQ